MQTTERGIPELGDRRKTSRTTWFAGLAVAGLLVAAALFGHSQGAAPVSQIKAFLPICATIWAFAELLTALLLLGQFYVAGKTSYAIVAMGYAVAGLLTVPYLWFSPGVFNDGPFGRGDLQISSWLWLTWHVLFPISVAVAHVFDGSLDALAVSRARISRTLAGLVAGAVATSGLIFAAIFFGRDRLPVVVLEKRSHDGAVLDVRDSIGHRAQRDRARHRRAARTPVFPLADMAHGVAFRDAPRRFDDGLDARSVLRRVVRR